MGTKKMTASKSPFSMNGLHDSDTHYSDKALFKQLGLKEFKKLPVGDEHEVGHVKLPHGSYVKIWVFPMPAQFWKFVIFNGSTNRTTLVSTGSGSLSDFWPSIKLIAEDMLVIDDIG